jgi:G:T/U-mismatch repair DNA glycosylase
MLLQQLPLCRAIVTTGEKATDTICQAMHIPSVPKVNSYIAIPETYNSRGEQILLYRLPSSSRAYPLSFDKKVEAYQRMFSSVLRHIASQ